jgi:flagellar export protein FliJ
MPAFRLESVLRLRQQIRQVQQQAFSAAQEAYCQTVAERNQLRESRSAVIAELRELNQDDQWDLEKVSQRSRYADELAQQAETSDAAVAAASILVDSSRQTLVAADQSAKSLERLADRHHWEEFARIQKQESAELDDFVNSRWSLPTNQLLAGTLVASPADASLLRSSSPLNL